jgi:hypothetical protein
MVIDKVENVVAVNEDGSAEALSLSIAIGICSIHACADSLELFSVGILMVILIRFYNPITVITYNILHYCVTESNSAMGLRISDGL